MKKQILFIASLVVLTTMITACGSGNGNGKGSTKGEEPSANNNEPAELVVFSMGGMPPESFAQQFGDPLRKKFPNYTIKYIPSTKEQGIKELIAAGQTIDLYFESIGFFISGLLDNNMQMDMTDLIKKHNVDVTKLESTTVDAMRKISGGKLYGVPVYNGNMVLYYNKDIFDKFGVPYPKDGMTWDDATALGNKLTKRDGDKQYVGLSTSPTHLLRMNQLSLPYVDPQTDKVTMNNDEGWKKLYDAYFIQPAQAAGYKEYMKAHKDGMPYRNEFLIDKDLAMFVWGTGIMFSFPKEFSELNWDMVSIPTLKEKPGIGAQAYPGYFSVTSMSKYKDQAMEVIKYLVSDEQQLYLSKIGVMPVVNSEVVKKAFGQDSQFKGKNFYSSFYNKFAPIAPKTKYDSIVESPYVHAASDIILGKVDMNSGFRSVEETGNKKIGDAKAAN